MKKHLLLTALAVLLIGSGAFAQITFFVTNPANLKGQYPFGRSSETGWGHNLDTVVAQGTLVVGRDSTAADSLGCNALVNAAACAGKIVVIYRGACEFGVKALNAQNAGAIGVVIINNVAGAPIILGAGANGANVTIPTLMVSQETGALLRGAIDAGTCTAIIGNKRGLFANDLGMSGQEVVVAPNYATPLSQVANGGGYNVPVGVSVTNYGTANRTAVLINANITFNGNVVYNQDTTATAMATNDSVNFAFSTFDPAPHGLGTYQLKYTVTGNGTEDFPEDNSVTTTFLITDSVWSKGRINATTGMPIHTNAYTKAGGGDVEIGAIFLANKGSRLKAMSLTGALSIGAADSLNNEAMVARMYDWTDTNADNVVDAAELTQLAEGFYTYTVNERYAYKKMSLDDIFTSIPGIVMSDSATYIFSIFYPGTKTALIACDEQVNYTTTVPFIGQRAVVVYTTQWFSDGFGRDIVPAINVEFAAINTSVQNQTRNDLKIKVYPNPASDHILIKVDGDQFLGEMNYQVVDITGRTVKTGVRSVNGANDSFRLDVQDLNQGTYSLVMKTKTGFNTTRFVVVH